MFHRRVKNSNCTSSWFRIWEFHNMAWPLVFLFFFSNTSSGWIVRSSGRWWEFSGSQGLSNGTKVLSELANCPSCLRIYSYSWRGRRDQTCQISRLQQENMITKKGTLSLMDLIAIRWTWSRGHVNRDETYANLRQLFRTSDDKKKTTMPIGNDSSAADQNTPDRWIVAKMEYWKGSRRFSSNSHIRHWRTQRLANVQSNKTSHGTPLIQDVLMGRKVIPVASSWKWAPSRWHTSV